MEPVSDQAHKRGKPLYQEISGMASGRLVGKIEIQNYFSNSLLLYNLTDFHALC